MSLSRYIYVARLPLFNSRIQHPFLAPQMWDVPLFSCNLNFSFDTSFGTIKNLISISFLAG